MSCGPAQYELLEWDSSFFGFPVARIRPNSLDKTELSAILRQLREAGIVLAYWFAADDDASIETAREFGGFFADRKTTYVTELSGRSLDLPLSSEQIEFYGASTPSPELEVLAVESGAMSRFRVDPRIPRGKFDELYRIWIREIVSGKLGDGTMIAKDPNGAISGFVTLGEKNGRADIGLLAVWAWARGRNVARQLVRAAQREFVSRGFAVGQVVTQGQNLPACRLYEACGYRIEKIELVFHFWLQP
jgi:dTDP-4-amino-4,6-dideoxy-D-galactose acyltransferase